MARQWSGKHVLAAFGLGVVISGITVARAATLGTLNPGSIGTSSTVVAPCDSNGIAASWDNAATSPVYVGSATVANSTFNVVTLKLTGVDANCNGKLYKFVIADANGTSMVAQSGTTTVTSGTITWTVAAQNSKTVGQVIVTIYQ